MAVVRLVRPYRSGDEEGIRGLFKEVFGRDMSMREWRWKYIESHPAKVYSIVAEGEDGNIVGHYGGVCLPYIFHGSEIYGHSIGDVMIHPKYRGIQAVRKLFGLFPAEAAKDGIKFGFGFPNHRAMRLPEKLGLYERVEDLMEGFKESEFHKGPERYLYKLFPLEYSDERIDGLWESCKGNIAISVVMDREYFTWRYKNHPLFTYELWGMKRRAGRRLKGLAVLRREGEEVMVMDFICSGRALGTLFRKLENCVSSSGGKTLKLWIPPFMENDFRELGYSVSNAGISIPRSTYYKYYKKQQIKGQFYYTMGSTDFL